MMPVILVHNGFFFFFGFIPKYFERKPTKATVIVWRKKRFIRVHIPINNGTLSVLVGRIIRQRIKVSTPKLKVIFMESSNYK